MRAAHKEVNMKYKNVVELIGHWERLMGREATLNRLRSMRDYARQCLKAHPHYIQKSIHRYVYEAFLPVRYFLLM